MTAAIQSDLLRAAAALDALEAKFARSHDADAKLMLAIVRINDAGDGYPQVVEAFERGDFSISADTLTFLADRLNEMRSRAFGAAIAVAGTPVGQALYDLQSVIAGAASELYALAGMAAPEARHDYLHDLA